MTQKPHLIVVGNGMAGCRAVEEILARDAGRYRITIFGAEPRVNYNRIMLSPLLAGDKSFDEIVINDHAWYSDNAIDLVSGDAVVAINGTAAALLSVGLRTTLDTSGLGGLSFGAQGGRAGSGNGAT